MKVIRFESIDSTNTYLSTNYQKFDDFTFAVAEEQTAGKGRNDRVWYSPKGKDLLVSFLIKDKEMLKNYKSLSLGCAYLVSKLLIENGVSNPMIKWPNDVYVDGRKICGILLTGNVNEYIVAGIGINVNQNVFLEGLRVSPTSMCIELDKEVNKENLLTRLIELTQELKNPDFNEKMHAFLVNHNYLLNKKVQINDVFGTVTGISEDCSILIDNKPFDSGEIKIIK